MFLGNYPALIAGIITLLFGEISRAQSVANYVATRNTSVPYNSILSAGLPCNHWRYSGAFQQDDNRSFPIPIGFDFWYNGIRYEEVSVSTNGYIDFSASTADGGPTGVGYGYVNAVFTQTTGTLNALAVLYDDFTTQGGGDPLGNSIRYLTTGTAPNRVTTIEWANMAVYLNTTPNLNFQVKLYEQTGVIEYCYGTMTPGTASYSYTVGMNAAVINAVPTAAQLKTLQAANTNTFNNTPSNNLNVLPAANSRYRFVPPVPANPTGSLTFTAVQQAQMTLNFANWATNEVGYAIYNSTDNVTWEFVTQTPANATSATITGLYSGTTYHWRVFAVTEGAWSSFLTGTQATLPAGQFISVTSGNWNTPSTWNTNAVPGPNNDVIIANGHTVTINTNAACNFLTIGQGGAATLRFGNNGTARTLSVGGDITINANATLTVNTASNITHLLEVFKNVTINGTLDLAPDANSLCNVTFNHPTSLQVVSGVPALCRFNAITVNKGSSLNRTVDVTVPSFTAATGFLTLVNGTFRISTSGSVNLVPFNGNATIDRNCRLWLNSPGATVTSASGNITLQGELRVSDGTMNVGTVANNSLRSAGGQLVVDGGVINIAGRYDRVSTATISRFRMSGGTLNVPTVGSSDIALAPFLMDTPGSQFVMSGGTIVIRREGGTGATDLGVNTTGCFINNVTGGTLQIGDALTPAGQTMRINTVNPFGSLRVNSANATAFLLVNPIVLREDVTLVAGVFNANNLNVTLGRNWTNTGGSYVPGTNTTFFNGSVTQTISRVASAEIFNHVQFSGTGIKELGSSVSVNNCSIGNAATFSAGTAGFPLTVRGLWVNDGSFLPGTSGTVTFSGTAAQSIGGTQVTGFRNITIQNAAGVNLAQNANLLGTLNLPLGIFTTTGFNFTLVSNASATARIAEITGGDLIGNITMQRFLPPGPTGWRMLGSCVNGTTLSSWNDDFFTSGFPGSQSPNFSFTSIYSYNETRPGIKDTGWVEPTNISNPVPVGEGRLCYIGPVPLTVDVTGAPAKFNRTFALTYTPSAGSLNDGWNLVANPYPSSINWDAPTGWVRTNVSGAVQVWNPTLQQYASYVGGVGINGGSNVIPSSQAFWVQTIGAAPAMQCTEAVKIATDQAFMRMAPPPGNYALGIRISGNSFQDETVVRFSGTATADYDMNEDAFKFYSTNPSVPAIATVNDSLDFSINSFPFLTQPRSVQLRTLAGVSGTYTLSRDSLYNLPSGICVFLEDRFTASMFPFPDGAVYSFQLSDTTSIPRFVIHFGQELQVGSSPAFCAQSADGMAFAQGIGSGPWNYSWYDDSNNLIAQHSGVLGVDSLHGLLPGSYTVVIDGNSGNCGTLEQEVVVEGPDAVQVYFDVQGPVCNYTGDGSIAALSFSGGAPPFQLNWANGDTGAVLTNLNAGVYQLMIQDANNCIDTFTVSVPAQSSLNASFTISDDSVATSSVVAFQNFSTGVVQAVWDFGNSIGQSNLLNPFYSYPDSGTYIVTMIASDSTCSDTATSTIYVFDPTGISESEPVAYQLINTGSIVEIHFSTSVNDNIQIILYNTHGQAMPNSISSRDSRIVQINTNGLAAGVYYLELVSPGFRRTHQVVLSGQ